MVEPKSEHPRQPRIVFVLTSRNVEPVQRYVTWNAARGQIWKNRRQFALVVAWIDDASDIVFVPEVPHMRALRVDGPADIYAEYSDELDERGSELGFGPGSPVYWVNNHSRRGGLGNLVWFLTEGPMSEAFGADLPFEFDDIIVPWDGDDFFVGPHVAETLIRHYEQVPSTLMTYGGYRLYPELTHGMPPSSFYVTAQEGKPIREQPWVCAPPRSFRYRLFRKLWDEHRSQLVDPASISVKGLQAELWDAAWDRGLYLPLMELAGPRLQRLSAPLYLYDHRAPNPTTRGKLGREAAARAHGMPRLEPMDPSWEPADG